MFRSLIPSALVIFARNGMRLVLLDRTLLGIDYFFATSLPLLMQIIIWWSMPSSISGPSMIFYFAYAIALNRTNNGYSTIEDVSYSIVSGRIETALMKPVNYPLQKLAEFMGGSIVYLPLVIAPAIADFAFNPELSFSRFPVFLGMYLLLITLGQLVCFLISFLISLLTFRTGRTDLVLTIYLSCAAFFGGILLPPDLWPEGARVIMEWNPFAFTVASISQFAITKDFSQFWFALRGGAFYTVLLSLVCIPIWNRVSRQYTAIGG